jgi:hypothetical protein
VFPALYLFGGGYKGPRYTVYWVPALCTLAAASVVAGWRNRFVRPVVLALLVSGAGMQAATVTRTALEGADGYEEAARFVLQASPGPTVLFSGDVDTGFFTFFVRKHDAARQLVVLRSDKLFTTSYMGVPSVEDRIQQPDEIYSLLHTFGTRYVVLEDRPSRSRVLEWLRQEVRSPRFVERLRIPIGTSNTRLRGTSLAVYELIDATPPRADAMLSLHLPIVRQSFTVSLSDLIDRKYLR